MGAEILAIRAVVTIPTAVKFSGRALGTCLIEVECRFGSNAARFKSSAA
jgi:hypothetical protein